MSSSPSPRAARWLAVGLVVAWLAFALPRLTDFGATWDCVLGEYPHGEQYLQFLKTGESEWLDFSRDPLNSVPNSIESFGLAAAPRVQPAAAENALPTAPRIEHRAPHLAYGAELYDWYESHPFGALLSAASCRLFWGRLAMVPALAAHNLPIVLLVALLLGLLVSGATQRWGVVAGVGAAFALLLAPRFLADAFNNLKDAPEAVLYSLSLVLWISALRTPRWWRFAGAGALTGLALAQKANALFLPVHVLLFLLLANLLRRRRGEAWLKLPWWGLLLGAGAGLLAWLAVSPMLWSDPFGRFSVQADYFAAQGQQSWVEQDFDGLRAFLFTTPPVLLLLAVLGACNRRASGEHRLLLGLGVLFPVARTMLPGAINFDGVRHFLEFMPFLALLAGLGLDLVLTELGRGTAAAWSAATRRVAGAALAAVLLLPAAVACADTWPFGNCYYNELAGGLPGAQQRRWKSATDYWGASYWQGFEWLSANAEPNAGVWVSVASHVADAIAPLRLRPDLQLLSSPQTPLGPDPAVLYVAYVTNRPFYGPLTWELEGRGPPAHEIRVQGAPIQRIHRFADPEQISELLKLGRTRHDPRAAARRFEHWLAMQPAEVREPIEALRDALMDGDMSAIEPLAARLPERLHRDAAWMLLARSRARSR